MNEIIEKKRVASPCLTPQALAVEGRDLWFSSRDLGMIYRVEKETWEIAEELDPPGIVWAAVRANDGWRFTIGKGLNDDRYIYRCTRNRGFERLFACPQFTGSYLSFDGEYLYLSQWYKGVIHQLDEAGAISRTIDVGAEICGQTFADGLLYVLRGRENKDLEDRAEEWRIARLDPAEKRPEVEDLASIPFASRSLAFDGELFWSNYRAANEVVAFALPV